MQILDTLLDSLNYDAPVRDIRMGPFQTAVHTRWCALASTPHEAGPHHSHFPVKDAGSLLEMTPRQLTAMAKSENLFEASIGMAAINSLMEVDESICQSVNAADILAEKGKGKKIAIIGHFPFVPRLRQVAQELWVIEKNPSGDDFNEAEGAKFIPRADVLGITGTAFTNHTMEQLLQMCSPKAFVLILGDTTPLSPILFDYGVDAVCGTRVVEPEILLKCVSQGATFRQLKGIKLLTIFKDQV
ncbi:MAG: DUF364 domain-containing protein [Dehalococcoidaceae bacterium]|nr:DUF364 domain-containing protein [Dehalococcoidaceae bacterium]